MKTKVLDCPAVPTTLNFRFSKVPDPVNDPAWKAEMIKCPGLLVFAVIDIALLTVPVASKAGDAGVTTAGSNVI